MLQTFLELVTRQEGYIKGIRACNLAMADEIFTQLQKEIGHQQKELERIESKLDANFA